jgi:AraC-like DNA-binding protein
MVTLDQGGAGAARLRIHLPAPPLAALVEYYWTERPGPGAPGDDRWRIVADDAPHLIFSTARTPAGLRSRLTIVGARRVFVDIDRSTRVVTVGARLRPGALPALFGLPASAVTDHGIALADFAPAEARTAMARLEESPSLAAYRPLESALWAVAACGRPVDPRARWVGRLPATCGNDLDQLARQLGLSGRALRAWSHPTLGLGLKRFFRIRRLHAVLRQRASVSSWSRAAALAGYADQAHCSRETRALLGEPPSAFRARRGGAVPFHSSAGGPCPLGLSDHQSAETRCHPISP